MTRRVQSARINGSLGGKQANRNRTEEQREQICRNAGNTLLSLYGKDYYAFLGSLNRNKPKIKKLDPPLKISAAARRFAMLAN